MKHSLLILIVCSCIFSCSKSKPDSNSNPIILPPVVAPASYKNFYVLGKTLKDSSGNNFVMRGNNFPVFWYPTQYKPSLGAAASLGCNSARLVWQVDVQTWTPSLAVLDEAIAECIAKKLIPIIELHDFTGGTSATELPQV